MDTIHTTREPAKPAPTGCCPPFDPAPWHEREVVWTDRLFVKEHVHSLFHVPIDLGRKFVHAQERIDAAGARSPDGLMLTDEVSPWRSDLYIGVTRVVPGTEMARLPGTFLTRVYDGPFRQARVWAEDMRRYVAARGRTLEKLYLAYTTCPACAKAYGHNYVVAFAKVTPTAT
jgi:hypothetical protein